MNKDFSHKHKVEQTPSQQDNIHLEIIARVTSPYKEKFAIPRQPGIVTAATGKVVLLNKANNAELVRGLEQFSHIWLLFVFHATQQQGWKPLVRPPRLGGNKKTGVLSTRSTFRPNPIGMSVVRLEKITYINKQVELHISGLDLLDQTPIVDIKPYIPYSDAILDAQAGFAQEQPSDNKDVRFSRQALKVLKDVTQQYPNLPSFIKQVLAQDPRPAYKQKSTSNNDKIGRDDHDIDDKVYGIRLYQFNIKWRLISANTIEVFEIH
ncbi:tRNA (N6-threonylcarbamoyladenosine(37)-N6)-methyltransferase TrmO [Colwellia sp. 1_MG-2023]|uniref:tRNA (N6-threonylcarbamoyladenosine(37)-N6)-methyltransferase TrmO n=1 Tax=Colwellia sp. 1_MG-2023 TaxID=3062649 RepID=UPI0026E1F2BC|nr:tRNA (N6-threonylcarbamoyladenosine(37)-N6)-methyltransferase TrmO [Colwellia sp. 1_MG-2023]MDO6446879.1 tRNA (N6-threonylcarbamoyladenosine(37)-N6)-methyltransferase TrmO [Colwellia sp. 1_MG-2023]